ncbi:hypothetical protein [Gemmobacter caeruleus]|uniref:DsrE family protein n=1 Tax=Agrobacterium tumefaciens TaxID=358 RepID=O31242_AGRTU|nr:hypothetical protein [Gemmobacter caeruleus]CAA73330.1 hypothetical protein [Agrobacterium tumefaciens]
MNASSERMVFVVQKRHELFDLMPFSIALTWRQDKNVDVDLYFMYDAVELLREDFLAGHQDLLEILNSLLADGAIVYACGFCSRACELSAKDYHPDVQVANRQIFHSLMTQRRPVYW